MQDFRLILPRCLKHQAIRLLKSTKLQRSFASAAGLNLAASNP